MYGQYCPVSRALDVLGERWALLIVRDLTVGTTRFNDLARGLPGLSRTLLAKRLRQLERAGLVDHSSGRYVLTAAGVALQPVIFGLAEWGARWVYGDPRPDELDADLLAWWMHDRLDLGFLPGAIHVVQLRFSDDGRQFWIVIEHGDASVCLTDPGFDVDLLLTTDVATLYAVWLGHLPLTAALRSGRLVAHGSVAVTSRLATVMQLSQVAPMVQQAAVLQSAVPQAAVHQEAAPV
ncbi:winged helix-turn-helix transcriptional regulator [Tersicoccus sp. MR15.9]|uniref:winged helix-turn-helix transcriptional regulator n=1 Tax=Tersicoccus mangrovi TaxID=3121635 RepID=UPI002FE571DE